MKLSQIIIYPIKSLGGISLLEADVHLKGLAYDRRWVLVNESMRFLSQRELPKLALFQQKLVDDKLIICPSSEPENRLEIQLEAGKNNSKEQVQVWDDLVSAQMVSNDANMWFSSLIGQQCRLFRIMESELRISKDGLKEKEVSAADSQPLLIIGEASLVDLNGRLNQAVEMKRFRPNLVFEGGTPYEEDNWQSFTIGKCSFAGVKPCARCQVITINPQSTLREKEPLQTLSLYRKVGNGVNFGLLVKAQNTNGRIEVGMEIKIN